jgi:hypothetical protein
MQLMEWNDLNKAPRSCFSQTAGAGYRKACTYTFWDDPPLNDPPSNRAATLTAPICGRRSRRGQRHPMIVLEWPQAGVELAAADPAEW